MESLVQVPGFLAHYYEAKHGPFRNLSDLAPDLAETVPEQIRAAGATFAGKRASDYLAVRRCLEERVREAFIWNPI